MLKTEVDCRGKAGRMGAAQSTDTVGGGERPEEIQYGFQVLRVDEHSPAADARLVPFFDYIISVNGVQVIQESPNVVGDMARNHVGRPMKIHLYNAKTDSFREATIIPSNSWGGKTLLGASIRFCQYTGAADRVWHVLETKPNSPAQKAGLVSGKDWIIGSPDLTIASQDDFYNLMIHNTNKPVRLIVYNIDTDCCREAIVTPSFEWGGEGCLGCDVGGGMLHRIPSNNPRSSPPAPVAM